MTRHVHSPRIAAHLAVLDEGARHVRLDVDLQLLAAERTRDQKVLRHSEDANAGWDRTPNHRLAEEEVYSGIEDTMTPLRRTATILFVLTMPLGFAAQAPEQPKIRPSQRGAVTQRIADTTVTIEYGRPVARGRELFGTLVPWAKVWCPGADEATTIEVTAPVKIQGKELAAGKYSLWADPEQDRWTMIFNRNAAVWHTKYPAGQDVLRVESTPRTGSHMETLAFYFPVVEGRKAELVFHWGTTVVPLSVEVH
jgi:hypothetical protein